MKINIKFNQVEQANKIANILNNKNLRGAKIRQIQKEPEEGSLGLAEFEPLIEVAVQSGLAAAVATSIFNLIKDFISKRKKENSSQNHTVISEQKSEPIEIEIENNGKKLKLKFTKGDQLENDELIRIINELS